jgi:hypothetical protein
MIRTVSIFVSLLALVLLSACRTSPPDEADDHSPVTYRRLEWLTDADPARDLGAAWTRNDRRFIGVYGFTAYTPGVPESASKLVAEHGVRYIEGTSDAIESSAHQHAVLRATEYAQRYNELLLERLRNAK